MLEGEVRTTAESIIAKYPNSRSAVLPLLFLVQSVEGHVTEQGMREVAEMLGLTSAQILASGSFYTMLKKKPTGEYLISVCRNISCTHRGARAVVQALEDRLGVEAAGQTTSDGRFTLETAECLATCDGAPSMQINYEDFYNVTPETAVQLVEQIASGGDVRSARGEAIKTHREISREVAAAGLRRSVTEMEHMRTVSGESPPADMAPGFRPKEPGTSGSDDGN